jgi:hypothetical protein
MSVPNAKWQPGTGKQVILKSDFVDIENAILVQGTVRMQPPLVWVDVNTVRIEATPDCVAAMQFTGMPNILNPAVQIDGGLSDGKVRSVSVNTSMILPSSLYGTTQTERPSQWYAVFATAASGDTDYTLKAIPFMRVKSQASQVISCSELVTIANARDYGFTADDSKIVGGKVYFLSGTAGSPKGLMRTIIHNNVAASATTIEYSGAGVSLTAGDWFICLPSTGTKFRLVGSIFNNSGSDIDAFFQNGFQVSWKAPRTIAAPSATPTEDITCAPPTAEALGVMGNIGTTIGHPDGTNYIEMGAVTYAFAWEMHSVGGGLPDHIWHHTSINNPTYPDVNQSLVPTAYKTFVEAPIKNCRYKGAGASMVCIYYKHPPGCGF